MSSESATGPFPPDVHRALVEEVPFTHFALPNEKPFFQKTFYADRCGREVHEFVELVEGTAPGSAPFRTARKHLRGKVVVAVGELRRKADFEFPFPVKVERVAQAFACFDEIAEAVLKQAGVVATLVVQNSPERSA
jgi:hypothetical protein